MIAAVGEPWNWVGLGAIVFVAVAAFSIGRYLKALEEREAAKPTVRVREVPTTVLGRPIHTDDVGHSGRGFIIDSESKDEVLAFMKNFRAEAEQIAFNYHRYAVLHGEDAAKLWLKEQLGKPGFPGH